ncbi:MAG: ABC transporter substrate-binding protein [Thermoplasmata archaeon]
MSTTVFAVALLVTAGVAVAGTSVVYLLLPRSAGHTTVVDDLGRKVDAPINASRIVVLAPSIVDIVDRLGLRDRLVGIGCTPTLAGGMANEYSPNQTTQWDLSPSLCVPDFPDLDTEQVALLEPNLVLASTLTSAADVDYLTSNYGIPVVILAPSTLEGIVGDVSLVAKLFPGSGPAATSLEANLEHALVNATNFDTNLSDDADPIPSVFVTYGFYGGEYYTYGPGTFGQSLVDLAGGSSLSSGLPLEYAGINASVLLVDQPKVILFGTSWNDPYLVAGQTPSVWNTTAPYWSQLNGSKVPIDVTLITEADPTMILALPWFLHYLHPSLAPAPATPPP